MTPSLALHAFSRPSPWLMLAILLTIAALAVLDPGREPARAGNDAGTELPPLLDQMIAIAELDMPSSMAAEYHPLSFDGEGPEPVTHQLEICETIDDNGDNVADSPIIRFDVSMQGGPTLLDNYTYYALEGSTVCSWFVLEDFGLDPAGTIVVTNDDAQLPASWSHAPGYPRHSVSGQPLQPGGTATLSYTPGETYKTVSMIHRQAVAIGSRSSQAASTGSTNDLTKSTDPVVSQPTPMAPGTGNADATPSQQNEGELTLLLLVLVAVTAAVGFGTVIRKAGEPAR